MTPRGHDAAVRAEDRVLAELDARTDRLLVLTIEEIARAFDVPAKVLAHVEVTGEMLDDARWIAEATWKRAVCLHYCTTWIRGDELVTGYLKCRNCGEAVS